MLFQETSAKEGTNVEAMMEQIVASVFARGIKCSKKAVRLGEEKVRKEDSCCG